MHGMPPLANASDSVAVSKMEFGEAPLAPFFEDDAQRLHRIDATAVPSCEGVGAACREWNLSGVNGTRALWDGRRGEKVWPERQLLEEANSVVCASA